MSCNGLSLALAKCHAFGYMLVFLGLALAAQRFGARGMSCAAVRVLVKAKKKETGVAGVLLFSFLQRPNQ